MTLQQIAQRAVGKLGRFQRTQQARLPHLDFEIGAGGRDLDHMSRKGVLDRSVERIGIADLADGLDRRGEIAAVTRERRRAGADLRAAGRRLGTTDAYGNKTLFFYDLNSRLTHSVNALGEVTEQQYDTLGQLSATIRYGTRLGSMAGLVGGLVSAELTTAIDGIRNVGLDSKQSFTYAVTGKVNGSTDELGYRSVEDVVNVHDLHATMLYLLGIDHKRLTVKFQGLDARLTGIAGDLVKGIIA